MNSTSDRVVIGMDPHKRSATIEVMTAEGAIGGGGRFATDRSGYAAMKTYAKQWPNRVWAIEGCAGIGRHIANRLVTDGEPVVDVPPKLSARARVFATGQGRKTDATDAHSVALVGTRTTGLRPVVNNEQLAVLPILVDRRRSLGEDHTRMVSQLHQLLLELIPGGAKKDLSARQAKVLLAKVRPTDAAGKTRRRVAAELISDLERIDKRKKAANKELTELVAATGTSLLALPGIGPSGAARLLVEVADITRFPDKAHFASWNGTAPIDASPATRFDTDPLVPATGRSTGSYTSWPASKSATQPRAATTTSARKPKARHPWRPCGARRDRSRTSSTSRCSTTPSGRPGRAREGNRETTLSLARPTHILASALRTSHFPDPPTASLGHHYTRPVDAEVSL
jgi:transposase